MSARPRAAKLERPVTLTAAVKALGRSHGVPNGSVEFLDGSTLLGAIRLGGGKATLRTSSLPAGRNAIRVQYVGAGDFLASTSGVVIQNIKVPHSRAKFVHDRSRPASAPSGWVSSVMVADRPPG